MLTDIRRIDERDERTETMVKILYVYHGDGTDEIPVTFRRIGYEVEEYPKYPDNFILNDEVIEELVNTIKDHHITHLFSIHLNNNVAVAAEKTGVKYISYIWDAPYLRLYSPFGRMKNCYFSLFDKLDCERFKKDGITNVMYSPLGIEPVRVKQWNRKADKALQGNYMHDICFLGRLYEDNHYDRYIDEIPSDMQKYFESIFEEAAFKWDGVNRIYGKTGQNVLDYIHFKNPDFKISTMLDINEVQAFESSYLVRKIANIERIAVLNTLAESYSVWLHTTSKVDKNLLGSVNIGPPVVPGDATTLLFAGSKINLNISLKGIEGGTPLRVMDVLAAGGFILTNYCSETAELFDEDQEIVMYKTPEELFDKVDYYLRHEEERKAIARRGQAKVLECYTLDRILTKIMDWVET